MDNNEILIKTLEKENSLLKENIKSFNKKFEESKKLIEANNNLIEENKQLREQLDSILYSRSYKFAQKIKKIIKK
jgi:hypothetical protein